MEGFLLEAFKWLAGGAGAGGGFAALRWMLDWMAKRHDMREARLDAEREGLDRSWKKYRLTLEQRLSRLERQNETLRMAFQDVAAALMAHDPQNPALKRASSLMAIAFPHDFSLDIARAEAALQEEAGV